MGLIVAASVAPTDQVVLVQSLGNFIGTVSQFDAAKHKRARNTANVTNLTAVMASLTDLSVTLTAGQKLTGRLVLFAKNSTPAEGLQFDFNGGTATIASFEAGFAAMPPGSGLALGVLTTTALATALTVTTATSADAVYVIEINLVCNAAGTFIPRFAEISHTTGTATVELGSYLWLDDMTN